MMDKTITRLAHAFSAVFSPLLVPTYGVAIALWFTVLTFIPTVIKWRVLGLVFGLTAVIPAVVIAVMKWRGLVSNFDLTVRRERPVPYCVVCGCYLVCAWCFHVASFPHWIVLFMCGASLATFISLIVNVWWKISAHLAGMGGLMGLVLRIAHNHVGLTDNLNLMLWVVALAGLVGASRVWLGRHTIGQVYAGTLNGLLCVYLMSA